MDDFEIRRRQTKSRRLFVLASVLAFVGIVVLTVHAGKKYDGALPAATAEEELSHQPASEPPSVGVHETEAESKTDYDVMPLKPQEQHVVEISLEEEADEQTAGVNDQEAIVELERRQDDGANTTSASSSGDDGAIPTSSPVEPPTSSTEPPSDTTELTTLTTSVVPPDTPTTTTSPPEETTTAPPPPETTSIIPDEPSTSSEPPTSAAPTTTTLVPSETTTEVSSTTEDESSTTTEEPETTEEPTTTEADDVTSSAVDEVITSTLPNGSVTTITSTSYVEVIASNEPTAEPTDPDLQNVAAGLSAGPAASLIVAFLATCYFMS